MHTHSKAMLHKRKMSCTHINTTKNNLSHAHTHAYILSNAHTNAHAHIRTHENDAYTRRIHTLTHARAQTLYVTHAQHINASQTNSTKPRHKINKALTKTHKRLTQTRTHKCQTHIQYKQHAAKYTKNKYHVYTHTKSYTQH